MRLTNTEAIRIAKERREFKDRQARDELAAIKRPDELTRLQGDRARLLVALHNLYREHRALLAASALPTGPAFGQAATLLRELEPES